MPWTAMECCSLLKKWQNITMKCDSSNDVFLWFYLTTISINQLFFINVHFLRVQKVWNCTKKNEFASEALDNWRFPCKAPLTLFVCRLVRRWIKDVALLGYRLTWHSVRESKAASSLQCLETFPPLRLCTRQGYCQRPLWKQEKRFISCSACWL